MPGIKFIRLYFVLFLSMILLGCSEKTQEVEPEPAMEVSVDFRAVHLCSRISPEMTVMYAPKGTKFYEVRLLENGQVERYLGGGRWQEDGTGLIPEGVLTRHYTGPCPPKDQKVEYVYVITAMESENSQPLATRIYKFTPDF